MKYSRFEMLALVLGAVAIVASTFVPSTAQIMPTEVVAQLLLIVVLAGALHWGRNGGFVTALIAIAIYVGMRYSTLSTEGLSPEVITMIVSRALGYTVVGVIGGELAGRLKYLLIRVERETMIDPVTRVYSAHYAGRAITIALGKYQRYETPCSVVTITIPPTQWASLKRARMNSLMRHAASHLRNDVRLVDDVAYRGNGSFIVILSEAAYEGALVAAERLRTGVAGLMDCKTTDITTHVLTCGRDDAQLETLVSVLAPTLSAEDESAPTSDPTRRRTTTDRASQQNA
ncbi:MAG: hypothetical protein RBS17_02140 [Coriobacteriia bacterium]|nr:hypothetical protein [Coriobacteriia bacterium]